MTLQVGIRAKDGSLVLASDTRFKAVGGAGIGSGLANRPKITEAANHDILIAFAGIGEFGSHPADELAAYLSRLKSLPEPIDPLLSKWGNRFFRNSKFGHLKRDRDMPLCRLLVVSPKTFGGPFLESPDSPWKVAALA